MKFTCFDAMKEIYGTFCPALYRFFMIDLPHVELNEK